MGRRHHALQVRVGLGRTGRSRSSTQSVHDSVTQHDAAVVYAGDPVDIFRFTGPVLCLPGFLNILRPRKMTVHSLPRSHVPTYGQIVPE